MAFQRIARRLEGKQADGTPGLRSHFFCAFRERTNVVTIKPIVVKQFKYLGHGERVVVELKKHDAIGSLRGQTNAHSRTTQGTYGTDYVCRSFTVDFHREFLTTNSLDRFWWL